MTEEEVPSLCIFQNSRTRKSAIWTKKKGWILCREDEYLAISVVADLLRSSPNVKETMEQISKVFTVLPEDDDDIVT